MIDKMIKKLVSLNSAEMYIVAFVAVFLLRLTAEYCFHILFPFVLFVILFILIPVLVFRIRSNSYK